MTRGMAARLSMSGVRKSFGATLALRGVSFEVGPGEVGFYIMIAPLSYIVGNYIATRIVLRKGERWMANAGQASTITGIAIVIVLALAGLRTPLAFAAPLVLMGRLGRLLR